jgi:ribonucleoside-diphosphate reductase beta chain
MRKRAMERQITSLGGLADSFPLRLYEKANRLAWDPAAIEFTRDASHWAELDEGGREFFTIAITLFLSGEESVVHDLVPLLLVMAGEGRLDEELYLTTFLLEEGKHTEFFSRFLDAVRVERGDLDRLRLDAHHRFFDDEVNLAMGRLLRRPTPAAQVRAIVTYCLIAEGVVAETGYRMLLSTLESRSILPGLRQGVTLIQRDESRHIAYGMHALTRLVHAHPELWKVVERRVEELHPVVLDLSNRTGQAWWEWDRGAVPLLPAAFERLRRRLGRIEAAREGLPASFDEEDED